LKDATFDGDSEVGRTKLIGHRVPRPYDENES
jgi:hypothetical protein